MTCWNGIDAIRPNEEQNLLVLQMVAWERKVGVWENDNVWDWSKERENGLVTTQAAATFFVGFFGLFVLLSQLPEKMPLGAGLSDISGVIKWMHLVRKILMPFSVHPGPLPLPNNLAHRKGFFFCFLDSFADFVCLIFDKVRINVPPDLLMPYSLLKGPLSHPSRWMNSFYR